MNRRERRAKRAKERRATKPKALRRAALQEAQARLASEALRVGAKYDPERYRAALRDTVNALRAQAEAHLPETLRTKVRGATLYTRDDMALTVVDR